MSHPSDVVQENHDKLSTVCAALKRLVDVVEAHEIESLQCDGKEAEHCDCLRKAVELGKAVLAEPLPPSAAAELAALRAERDEYKARCERAARVFGLPSGETGPA